MPEPRFLQTSVYLTAEDQRMLGELQARTGMNRSELVRHAVTRMYVGGDEDDNGSRRTRLIELAEEIKKIA